MKPSGHNNTNRNDRLAATLPCCFDALFVQAATAYALRFLRQPRRPKPPIPVAKSGSAAGSGVAAVVAVAMSTLPVSAKNAPIPLSLVISSERLIPELDSPRLEHDESEQYNMSEFAAVKFRYPPELKSKVSALNDADKVGEFTNKKLVGGKV